MDLASLDATVDAAPGEHFVMARKQHGGKRIPLTDQQYRDLITVQLADWLEQVRFLRGLADILHTRQIMHVDTYRIRFTYDIYRICCAYDSYSTYSILHACGPQHQHMV